jgi:hypothetical protein
MMSVQSPVKIKIIVNINKRPLIKDSGLNKDSNTIIKIL